MRILVKVGGAQLEETGPRGQLCLAIAAARKAGHEVVVVHGSARIGHRVTALCGTGVQGVMGDRNARQETLHVMTRAATELQADLCTAARSLA